MSLATNNVTSSYIGAMTENRLNLNEKKRSREQFLDEQSNAKRAKISHEVDCPLLHLFVEYAWEDTYGKFTMDSTIQLADWLWDTKSSDVQNHDNQLISAKLSHTLRFVLPILKKCNGDVKYTDDCGQTILHVFLKHYMWSSQPTLKSDLKLNKLVVGLITKGASVNVADKSGITPFSIAVTGFKRDLCWTMLPFFDNVNAYDYKGETVLHQIAGNRSLPNIWCDVVRVLLTKGADPNRRNKMGLTPVHLAAGNGKDRILQVFANNNADFSLRTPKDETTLLLYCRNNKSELMVDTVELLLTEDCDVNVPDEFGFSPIHYATKNDANAVVDRLGKFQAERKVYSLGMSVTMMSTSFTSEDDSISEAMGASVEFSG